MGSSLKIASVFGIELRINVSFLFLLGFFWFRFYEVGGVSGAVQGVVYILILFACVTLHEFGHAFAARAFGIQTRDITLYAIGGVARLNRIPEKPWQELIVAIAGPLVNVVIAAALFLVMHVSSGFQEVDLLENPRIALLDKVAWANVLLILFNLIPAFPMDGGRVLRALLAMVTPYARATQIAAWIGQGLAVVFVILGFKYNAILIFIGISIFIGAQQEVVMSRTNRPSPP
jgi:Zn-dependent protease